MQYVQNLNFKTRQLVDLYDSVGWSSYTQDPALLKTAVNNSLLTITAVQDNELIGLVRVIGDGVSIIYIQDLLVRPSAQHHGIGSQLVKLVLEKYQSVRQKVLLTIDEPETRAFYEQCGFSSCDQGQEVAFYQEF